MQVGEQLSGLEVDLFLGDVKVRLAV